MVAAFAAQCLFTPAAIAVFNWFRASLREPGTAPIGPYDELPDKWKALKAELEARGEKVGLPSLEVYGHHCEDESKQETTILMKLE
jgi:hypothetical protein